MHASERELFFIVFIRMVRGDKIQSNSGKKPSKIPDENEYVTTSESDSPTSEHRESVHKQNLYIVSFPIIILFNILRSILYQIFIIFKYIFNVSSHFLYQPVQKTRTSIEVRVNSDKLHSPNTTVIDGMAARPLHISPGPGDPLLAKQKHHHRRAFEYISKALKIDEENEGEVDNLISLIQLALHLFSFCRAKGNGHRFISKRYSRAGVWHRC